MALFSSCLTEPLEDEWLALVNYSRVLLLFLRDLGLAGSVHSDYRVSTANFLLRQQFWSPAGDRVMQDKEVWWASTIGQLVNGLVWSQGPYDGWRGASLSGCLLTNTHAHTHAYAQHSTCTHRWTQTCTQTLMARVVAEGAHFHLIWKQEAVRANPTAVSHLKSPSFPPGTYLLQQSYAS